MRIPLTRRDALQGLLIYASGDTVAALILGQFSWRRLLGMMLVGATVYAVEIPAYFRWIDRRTEHMSRGLRLAAARTGLALLYFNPLWIARHLAFIAFFNAGLGAVRPTLLHTALLSWLVNIPLSIVGNAVIQVGLPLRWRFAGSATFSGLMAVYYALSGVWFGAR
ncbi:MAG TPA: hypothetical protein ENK19_11555 [Acidobacteria bacterium]|nr:hypothetical protein [Acidobacteriota bacterium]